MAAWRWPRARASTFGTERVEVVALDRQVLRWVGRACGKPAAARGRAWTTAHRLTRAPPRGWTRAPEEPRLDARRCCGWPPPRELDLSRAEECERVDDWLRLAPSPATGARRTSSGSGTPRASCPICASSSTARAPTSACRTRPCASGASSSAWPPWGRRSIRSWPRSPCWSTRGRCGSPARRHLRRRSRTSSSCASCATF